MLGSVQELNAAAYLKESPTILSKLEVYFIRSTMCSTAKSKAKRGTWQGPGDRQRNDERKLSSSTTSAATKLIPSGIEGVPEIETHQL